MYGTYHTDKDAPYYGPWHCALEESVTGTSCTTFHTLFGLSLFLLSHWHYRSVANLLLYIPHFIFSSSSFLPIINFIWPHLHTSFGLWDGVKANSLMAILYHNSWIHFDNSCFLWMLCFHFDPAISQHTTHTVLIAHNKIPHFLQHSFSMWEVLVTFMTPSLLENFLILLHSEFLLEFPTTSNLFFLLHLEGRKICSDAHPLWLIWTQ